MQGHTYESPKHVGSEKKGHAPFPMLANKPDVGFAQSPPFRFARMFCTIKNEDISHHRFRGNQVWILGHVPRSVDLPIMVDFLDDLYPGCRWKVVAAQFPPFIVIVCPVKFIRSSCRIIPFRYLHGGNLQVILRLSRCMGTQQEAMRCVWLLWVPVCDRED